MPRSCVPCRCVVRGAADLARCGRCVGPDEQARPQVCIIVGTSVSNRRLELISVDPQAGPAGTEIGSWQRDYLMADPRDYNMAEDIEGLSSTVPLRAQTGGPLHLLRQTKMGVPAKAKGAAAKPVAAAQKAVPRGAAKHVKALKGKRAQSLCGVGSGCEFESDQNVGSAEVIRMSTDPDVRARRALFREIDTNGDGQALMPPPPPLSY